MSLGLSNNNPELKRTIPVGHFGSVNAGFGLLPGLELVGRLAYEGELDCRSFDPACRHGQRDLSLSGKYQLPVVLPLDGRVALGFTDHGGPTARFRQFYGVATSTWGPLDLSLGYGRPRAPEALLDGPFGSVALRVSDRWSAALEHDSCNARTGLHYSLPLLRDAVLQLGVSRLLGQDAGLKPWQASVALNLRLGRVAESAPAAVPAVGFAAEVAARAAPVSVVTPSSKPVSVPATELTSDAPVASMAASLAQALVERGFDQVEVRRWAATAQQPALWSVRAEPRRWRQSQIDALGAALAGWLQGVGAASDELLLALTWQREPVLHAHTSARCLEGWRKGWSRCELDPKTGLTQGRALALSRELDGLGASVAGRQARLRQTPDEQASAEAGSSWAPQFEIGPGLRYAAGTELGLLDYSAALELGAEVNLAPGLFWQGVLSAPLAHSDDYGAGQVLATQRHPGTGLDSSLLTWWKPLPQGLAAQASAGQIERDYQGVLGDAVWMSPDGRWRLDGTLGNLRHEVSGERQTPLLAGARWSVAPGAWQVEANAGRFLEGDRGYRLSSNHWFGDTLLRLYYHSSEGDAGSRVAGQRKFLGLSFSLPLGPAQAYAAGGAVTLRGADRFSVGLETRVGERDNRLTPGYGKIPRVRHGLLSDVTDHDRNGGVDLVASSPRLRAVLNEQLGR